jgi:hypothetical protein
VRIEIVDAVITRLIGFFRRHFGKPNTPYDFGGVNLTQAREKCRELESQQKSMGRKINNKVMGTLDKYVGKGNPRAKPS